MGGESGVTVHPESRTEIVFKAKEKKKTNHLFISHLLLGNEQVIEN